MATQQMQAVALFGKTTSETNRIINDIREKLMLSDDQHAYHALRATLFAIRDRLPINEALKFGGQLPTLIRGIYYENYAGNTEVQKMDQDELISAVASYHDVNLEASPDDIARTTWQTITDEIDAGVANNLRAALPAQLVEFLESSEED